MNDRINGVREMLRGFQPLGEQRRLNRITGSRRLTFEAAFAATVLMKLLVDIQALFLRRELGSCDSATGYRLVAKGTSFRETRGGDYLSKAEAREFEQTGILGPFQVLSESAASNLATLARDLHESDFNGKILIGNRIADAMRQSGSWTLNYSGMFQAIRQPELARALGHPRITQRLASLLGDDILLWRSQFFEKQPNTQGTFWHQTGTFREGSKSPKLAPTSKNDPPLVQLTAWLALTHSTIENGCLRFVPGSFEDGRFEQLAYELMDNPTQAIRGLSLAELRNGLWAMKFTPGNFTKAQFLFDIILNRIPDLFDHVRVYDLEMKPGQCVIFTSMNMHASYPNVTTSETRLALAGRYTTTDVRVVPVQQGDKFTTPKGDIAFSQEGIGCLQVHGRDCYGHNLILPHPQ